MSLVKGMILPIAVIAIFVCYVTSQDPRLDGEERQDILLKSLSAAYGKRPSGHSFVRFGKRADNKGHSYMYFGKRAGTEDSNIADLLQYIQRSQEPSWKRGHSIMRFGKRSDRHNFIRFGKKDTADAVESTPENEYLNEEEKRQGHSMMYFGKRGGHSMLYFGKRYPYNDEDNEKRGGHSMLYFGKRSPFNEEVGDNEKRGGHSMLYFGKRSPYADDDLEKKAGHSMLYFGKRAPYPGGDNKKGGHSMLYFGKREPGVDDNADVYPDGTYDNEMDKRGPHSMIHFGKRYDDEETEKEENLAGKRAHSMIHFGKRSDNTENALSNNTNDEEKRAGHDMIHFGKREQDSYNVAHEGWTPMLRPLDLNDRFSNLYKSEDGSNPQKKDNKKSHMMIHFGKRSIDGDFISNEDNSEKQKDDDEKIVIKPVYNEQNNSEEKTGKQKIRAKREVEPSDVPLLTFSPFVPGYDTMDPSDGGYTYYGYEYPLEGQSAILPIRKIRSNGPNENSKNIFLRFGRR